MSASAPAVASAAGELPGTRTSVRALAPALLALALLLLATLYDGAFDVRHWAPVALFALVLLVSLAIQGWARPLDRASKLALVAIWALAAWTILSATWAGSVERALEGGARTAFYAALVSVALLAVPGPREARKVGAAAIAGVSLIAVVTLVRMHLDGASLFVAGRLDAPTGYRNASACLFAIPFWPLLGVAASKARNPSLRAISFALAVLTLGLAFVTQSRGALIGLVVGGAIALFVGPEWIRRPWLALLAAAGLALLSDPLLAAHRAFESAPGIVTAEDVARSTNALTFLVFDALIVGILFALLDGGLRTTPERMRRARRVAAAGLVIGTLAVVGGAVAVAGDPIAFVREKLEEFQAVPERGRELGRLISTGGERYDLWRVAAAEFAARPLTGQGEGSYALAYYRERASARNLTEPHSLPMRLLAGTGVVGALLFAVFVGALLYRILQGSRGASLPARRAAAGLAGAAGVVLGQGLVDWVWVVPGVMGLGLLCLALAANAVTPRPSAPAVRSRSALLGRGALGAGALAAALLVVVLFIADFYVGEARGRAAESPAEALAAANRAAALNPWAVTPRYLQAGALEALGRVDAARAELAEAAERESGNFVPYGLLGDLDLRAGDRRGAHRAYRHAAARNRRDPGIAALVRCTRPRPKRGC